MESQIAIVIPCFCSGARIGQTLERWADFLEESGEVPTFILVDDHSDQQSWIEFVSVVGLVKRAHIRVYRLRKNHGQAFATCFGIAKSNARITYTADDDLKIEPKAYHRLQEKITQDGADYGFISIDGHYNKDIRGLGSMIFNAMVSKKSGYKVRASNHRIFMGSRVPEFILDNFRSNLFIDSLISEIPEKLKFTWVKAVAGNESESDSRHNMFRRIRLVMLVIVSYWGNFRGKMGEPDSFVEEVFELGKRN
ncbi:MAG: glycosyltransferase [Flavobacteriales bacterium]|nr:glycosyltransferase [Flavobacteriales bacterium]